MVKISAIVPVYNVEEYLGECLDSLINQTFEDIEIICVNDGSTDSSPEILDEYQNMDSRIRIISQENRGLSGARNTGMEHARGEYIYFIDSDDYLERDALEELYSISQQKNSDLIIFKLVNFDEEGNRDYDYSNMPFLSDIQKDVFSHQDFRDNLFNVDVTVYTKFYKRELIENEMFAEGLIFEDNAFYFDYILDAERIYFHDRCLINRRIRSDSIIKSASKSHTDIIKIYELIEEKLKAKGVYEDFREDFFMRKVDSIYYRFTLIDEECRDYFYNKMKDAFLGQKEEYENDMDLKKIEDYHRRVFESVLLSNGADEIKPYMKAYALKRKHEDLEAENERLKKENSELKKANESLSSSKGWKIANPLKRLRRK
jgi:glycosyltransferase involved in cell wall biosynthesis